jgi:hypothetical protein
VNPGNWHSKEYYNSGQDSKLLALTVGPTCHIHPPPISLVFTSESKNRLFPSDGVGQRQVDCWPEAEAVLGGDAEDGGTSA